MLNFTNILSFFFLCPQTAISTSCRYRKLYFRLKDDRGDRVSFAEDRRESLPGLSFSETRILYPSNFVSLRILNGEELDLLCSSLHSF